MSAFANYEEFCKGFKDEASINKERAQLLYYLRSWFNASVDWNTSIDEYSNIDSLTSSRQKNSIMRDALSKIVDDVYMSFRFIAQNLHEKIIRENKLVPIYKVREVNSYGLNWLSKRNGRTVREKLSGTSSMMAVHQRNSFDTGENRLFLAFAKRLLDTLEIKSDYVPKGTISENEKSLCVDITQFLRREELSEIKRWDNLPPNNTLLSDKHYSKIWRGWNDLQKLDELIREDDQCLDDRLIVYVSINILKYARCSFALAQQPIKVNYEHFSFTTCLSWVTGIDKSGNILQINWDKVDDCNKKYIRIFFNKNEYTIKIKDNNLYLYKNMIMVKKFLLRLALIEKTIMNLCKELWGLNSTECSYSNKIEPIYGKHAIVDIFSVRPDFCIDGSTMRPMPFRVMRQSFISDESYKVEYDIDAAMSDCLYAEDGWNQVKCYTLSSVLSNPKDIRATRLLSIINNYLHVNKLTFVFPDLYNDFQLSNLRKAIRVYYANVEALPASIACAFAFAQTREFQSSFKPEDSLVVVNIVNDKCTLTLLESNYDEDIEKAIPNMKGVVWERHPSSEYSAIGYKQRYSVWNIFQEKLMENGCQQTELIKNNYSVQDISCECDKLMFLDERCHCFAIDKTVYQKEKGIKCDITEIVKEFIENKRNFIQGKKCHIVLLSCKLEYKGNLDYYYSTSVLEGAKYYESISPLTDKPLWKDHLPALAIKQFLGVFDLVKDKTVEPLVNNVVEIKIDEHFTLPARKPNESPDYHFRLQMNDGNNSLQYEAVVYHPAFPLSKDIECNLHMFYDYGADDPYTLIFEPIDKIKAGFTEVKVDFKPIEKYKFEGLPVPDFPVIDSWDDLSKLPSKYGDYTINVVSRAASYFKQSFGNGEIVDLRGFERSENIPAPNNETIFYARGKYKGKLALIRFNSGFCEDKRIFQKDLGIYECSLKERPRYTYDDVNWKQKRDGDWYAVEELLVDNQYQTIFFYENSFLYQDDIDIDENIYSFTLRTNKNGKKIARELVPNYVDFYDFKNGHLYTNDVYFRKEIIGEPKWLFFFHKIFIDGRNIDDINCPKEFRNIVVDGVKKLIRVLDKLDYSTRQTAIKVLSLTVSPECNYFYPLAKKLIVNYGPGNKVNDEIGFVLGDCSHNEQIELFNKILSIPKRRKILNILSKAAWKNRNFIFNINPAITIGLFDDAVNILIEGKESTWDQLSLFEFVLAVFRLRSLNDEEINRHLSLNNPSLCKLCKRIEEMVDKGIKLPPSRLQLSVKRSEAWKNHRISDFLYACLVYITGESGESEIRITGISDAVEDGC